MNKIILIFLILTSFSGFTMTTSGNKILNENGEIVELKGINWFGFNNQQTMLDGLWGGPDSLSFDFATVVYRMQLLGFNAVRLPFSFKDLMELHPRNFTHIAPIPSSQAIEKSVTNPSYLPSGSIPEMIAPPLRTMGLCNDYLPNESTLQRFVYVARFFAENGFYILIDNHLREDQTVLQNEDQWIQNYIILVQALSEDPCIRKKLMIDILNEPDNYGLRWERLQKYYIKAMDALYPINPEALFFIEGTGQSGIGANWGDGFATDKETIAKYGLSDPNPFFQELLKKPYLNQVVISPHVYPPSVTHTIHETKEDLKKRISLSFGYLSSIGYNNKLFPIAIGEFGSRFTETRDLEWLAHFADCLEHASWFFWCWNANSGDTGGIVHDNWIDIHWNKIDYLTHLGLRPWYFQK